VRRLEVLALAALAATGFPKPGSGATLSRPQFAEAVAGIEDTIARDRANPLIEAAALPRLYHHGKPTAKAVLLYHGFTNCPQQFDELARAFYDRGCNVYVPRIPFHGYRDRLTNALSELTGQLLAEMTTESYRLTSGLGADVSAVGLSLGGSMALYLAQTQPIAQAVPIAPFLSPIKFPDWLGLAAMTVVSWLPDHYTWWDPRIKEKCLPLYAYPGFPSHSLAQCIFFGNDVMQAAKSGRTPLGRRCTLVTNRTESAVNNAVAAGLLDTWGRLGAHYDRVELTDLGSPRHDIIDPTTFPQARALVYPKLLSIVLDASPS
jgi:pimeloyl-ACP methyl ester carboxylesterase